MIPKQGHKRPKMKLKVGDRVSIYRTVRDFDRERTEPSHTRRYKEQIEEAVISKVGTKYAYVGEGYSQRKFSLETGEEVGRWNDGQSTMHNAYSLAEYLRRKKVLDTLADRRRGYGDIIEISANELTTEGLERLRDLLNEEIYL